jgi:hypothetical protein
MKIEIVKSEKLLTKSPRSIVLFNQEQLLDSTVPFANTTSYARILTQIHFTTHQREL